MDMIGARIPRHLMGEWIRYCRRLHIGQAEAIRCALAHWIESNERATKEELAMAAQLRDAPCRMPRG